MKPYTKEEFKARKLRMNYYEYRRRFESAAKLRKALEAKSADELMATYGARVRVSEHTGTDAKRFIIDQVCWLEYPTY